MASEYSKNLFDIVKNLTTMNKHLEEQIKELKDKSKKQSLMYDELCYENDEINRKWAEDNEQNKTMIEFLEEKIELLEKQLDSRD